jgi:hypothetical protein
MDASVVGAVPGPAWLARRGQGRFICNSCLRPGRRRTPRTLPGDRFGMNLQIAHALSQARSFGWSGIHPCFWDKLKSSFREWSAPSAGNGRVGLDPLRPGLGGDISARACHRCAMCGTGVRFHCHGRATGGAPHGRQATPIVPTPRFPDFAAEADQMIMTDARRQAGLTFSLTSPFKREAR